MVLVGPCLSLYWFPVMKTQMYGGGDRLVASPLRSIYCLLDPRVPLFKLHCLGLLLRLETQWDPSSSKYTYRVWKANFQSISHTNCSFLERVVVVAGKVMLWFSFNSTTVYLLIFTGQKVSTCDLSTPRRGLMSWVKLHTNRRFAQWRYFTTRILFAFSFIFKFGNPSEV